MELMTKAATLLIIVAGWASGRMALAQALVINLIVVEVVVIAVAAGIVVSLFRKNGSLDIARAPEPEGLGEGVSMSGFWFFPPLAFGIVLLLVVGHVALYEGAWPSAASRAPARRKSYACGEDMDENSFSPDYSQFFSFAFFFSIMHVVALMVATMPAARLAELFMPACTSPGPSSASSPS